MDPLGDFITRIKNAGSARKETVSAPFSKMKFSVAELLKEKNFIKDFVKKGKTEAKKTLVVTLSYNEDGSHKINEVKRVSKPSRRLYESSKNIKPFRDGHGYTVLSTPKGIMVDIDAKKAKLGGEVLFKIW
jgi:small subunit ribosomal protein S8